LQIRNRTSSARIHTILGNRIHIALMWIHNTGLVKFYRKMHHKNSKNIDLKCLVLTGELLICTVQGVKSSVYEFFSVFFNIDV
jgi:hypothetical protein